MFKKIKYKITEVKSTVVGIITGIALGIVLILTGCGDKEDVSAELERVVEYIDEDGNVLDISEAQVEAEVEALVSPQSESVDSAGEANETNEANETSDEDVVEEISRDVEQLESDKNYLEYMSPDELRGLAVEALKEAGCDTALAEGRLVTKGITFELPEGFEKSDEVNGMYITGRYPIDATNIYYSESGVDYTLQLLSEEEFANMIKESYTSGDSAVGNVSITEFKKIKIDGVPTIRAIAEYDLDEYHFIQLIYMINGSKTYSVVFTETSEYDRMEIFEECAATISVQK